MSAFDHEPPRRPRRTIRPSQASLRGGHSAWLTALRPRDVPRPAGVTLGQPPAGREPRGAADTARVHAQTEPTTASNARTIPQHPLLDEDGLLHVGAAWVALSPTNEKLARLLLADFGRLVPNDTLVRALNLGGQTKSIRPYITRLRQSIEPLGLAVRSERLRGYCMNFTSEQGGGDARTSQHPV